MKRDYLKEAAEILKQRGTGYDNGEERNAAQVAAVFNALTGHTLSEADAWTFLIVLELVRQQRQHKPDNIVALCAYGSLLGECLDSGVVPAAHFRASIEEGVKRASDPQHDLKRIIEHLQTCSKGHCSYSKDGTSLTCEDCGEVYDWIEPPDVLINLNGPELDKAVRAVVGSVCSRKSGEDDHEYRKWALRRWFDQLPVRP